MPLLVLLVQDSPCLCKVACCMLLGVWLWCMQPRVQEEVTYTRVLIWGPCLLCPVVALRCLHRLSWLCKGSRARAQQFHPRPAPTTTEYEAKLLPRLCLGFVSKDDCPGPFIATVWDSLPGPAPILQGIFQKAKAVFCNSKGTLSAEVKGEKGVFLL